METILIEVWLPYDPIVAFLLIVIFIYVGARMLWRIIPVIGG